MTNLMTINPARVDAKLIGYQNLMSQDDWSRLHPAIQRRFSDKLYEAVVYQGQMQEVYLSFAGKLLAQCCRLIGSPLALHSEKSVPIKVKVYPNKLLGGMTWDRFYHYRHSSINRVKSTKCINSKGKLEEMVGYGFGMELDVYEYDHAIIFESSQFFWKLGNFQLTIPDWLSPGKTIVSQRALDEDRFEFRLDVTHRFLGKVFKQSGCFSEQKE